MNRSINWQYDCNPVVTQLWWMKGKGRGQCGVRHVPPKAPSTPWRRSPVGRVPANPVGLRRCGSWRRAREGPHLNLPPRTGEDVGGDAFAEGAHKGSPLRIPVFTGKTPWRGDDSPRVPARRPQGIAPTDSRFHGKDVVAGDDSPRVPARRPQGIAPTDSRFHGKDAVAGDDSPRVPARRPQGIAPTDSRFHEKTLSRATIPPASPPGAHKGSPLRIPVFTGKTPWLGDDSPRVPARRPQGIAPTDSRDEGKRLMK